MTINYYIQTYRLSPHESSEFQEMADKAAEPGQIEALRTYAERWIKELRFRCPSEAACRAVMFRYVLDIAYEAGMPDAERMVGVSWAHFLTDKIQQMVEEEDATH